MCTGDGFLVIGSLKTLVINTCLTEIDGQIYSAKKIKFIRNKPYFGLKAIISSLF
jgi:hypothetical protein